MKDKSNLGISVVIVCCILLNLGGKALAEWLKLPLWLDSFGTVLVSYMMGPICGAIVGCAGNIIYGFFSSTSIIYALTSIMIGIIVGITAKKGMLESLFGTMSVSVLITLSSVLISTPLNIILYQGMPGNIWGDSVILFLQELGVNRILADAIGEFYIDFLDKVVTLITLFIWIRLLHKWKEYKHVKGQKTLKKTTGFLIFLVLFLMVPSEPVLAKDSTAIDFQDYNTYIQTRYNSDNGLSCGSANDIEQTSNGILWIGTYAGLYRYNGSEFRRMGEFDSVRNVNCLFGDEEGRLWIGTNDNGMSIMINEKIVNVVDTKDGLPSNSVRCIIESTAGDYYVGTTDSMQLYTLNSGLETLNTIPEIKYADSITADKRGHVATVTAAGELFVLQNREILFRKKLENSKEIYTSCAFDSNGYLYVGTSDNKIEVYAIASNILLKMKTITCEGLANINEISFMGEKDFFVCADTGIGYFDELGNYTLLNTNRFNNSIDTMLVDYQGDLWFVSSRMGLLRMCKSAIVDIYNKMSMEGKVVNSVTEWQNCLYIGTDTGLDIIDKQMNRKIENSLTEQLKNTRIRCIHTDKEGHLWIGSYGKGLYEVDETEEITVYNADANACGDRIRVVIALSDGSVAATGELGISIIKNHNVIENYRYGEKLNSTMVLSLMESDDHSILAGTDGDGLIILKDGKVIKTLTQEDGLSSNVILRTVKDPNKNGTFIVTSNGLCFMDEREKIRFLDEFPYFNNYDVWPDYKGNLFVLGSAGIFAVDRQSLLSDKNSVKYEIIDAKSGLTGALVANSWNYCDKEGNLYISCDSGVFLINLYHYNNTNRSYRMMVSKIKLNDVDYVPKHGESFKIDRDTDRIEIFPEVINYTTENPYVRYYMEGFDKSPTTVLQSELTSIVYTNLPKGEYTFHLSVLDNKKTVVLEKREYKMIKEKAFYDHRWFQIYMLLVFMLAVAWLTWFIVRTQVQRTLNFQKKELEFAKNQVRMGNETILAIARTVDAKDVRTSKHSMRVSEYSVLIGRKLGFDEKECENLRKAALLHDIGKIGIADKVLNKPSKLDDDEYKIMKSHVIRGAEILKDFTLVEHVVDGAMYHHERYDGKGYVHGLKGDEIPIYARIIGVADAFDAMTSNRVYRKKLDVETVLAELEHCKGTQFDPVIDDIMQELIREKQIDMDKIYEEQKERAD